MIDDGRLAAGLQRAVGVLDVNVDTRLHDLKARSAQRASRRRMAVAGGALLLAVAVLAVGLQLNREPEISVTTEGCGVRHNLLRNVPRDWSDGIFVVEWSACGWLSASRCRPPVRMRRRWRATGFRWAAGALVGPFHWSPSASSPATHQVSPLPRLLGLDPRSVRRYVKYSTQTSSAPMYVYVYEGAFDPSKLAAAANGEVVDVPALTRTATRARSTSPCQPPNGVVLCCEPCSWARRSPCGPTQAS